MNIGKYSLERAMSAINLKDAWAELSGLVDADIRANSSRSPVMANLLPRWCRSTSRKSPSKRSGAMTSVLSTTSEPFPAANSRAIVPRPGMSRASNKESERPEWTRELSPFGVFSGPRRRPALRKAPEHLLFSVSSVQLPARPDRPVRGQTDLHARAST